MNELNVNTILDDLAKVWNDLSDDTQKFLSTILAGKRKGKNIVVNDLLKEYDNMKDDVSMVGCRNCKNKELIERILKGGDITPRDTGSDDGNPKHKELAVCILCNGSKRK